MLHEHFQDSLIVHNLIFILIGFAGVAIVAFSPPRGLKSKTLCIILCCILVGGAIVDVITTSAGKIEGLEATIRGRDEAFQHHWAQSISDWNRAARIQREELKQNQEEIKHTQEKIREMNENSQRLLRQLVAQGGLSQEKKKRIDAVLAMTLMIKDEAMDSHEEAIHFGGVSVRGVDLGPSPLIKIE